MTSVWFSALKSTLTVPSTCIRTFFTILKIFKTTHCVSEANVFLLHVKPPKCLHLKKQAVCFRNALFCFEYFKIMEKVLVNYANITDVQPLSKFYVSQ